jgi:glycogen(starch) synthase
MKILVVTNLYPPSVVGGYEISCSQIVEALRQRGHTVRVLTSIPDTVVADGPGIRRVLRHPDVFNRDRPRARSSFWELESNLINAGNVYHLLEELQHFEPDVCHLWNLVGIGGAAIVGVLEYLGIPWVWHLGDAVPAQLCIYEGGVLPLAHEMSRRLTGTFQAVSQGLVNEIEQVVPLGDRVSLVPNWVADPTPNLQRTYSRAGELKIVFAGQLNEHKGVFLLIEALTQLHRSGHSTFSLDLYGRGDVATITEHVIAGGLQGRVHLRDWVTQQELREAFRRSDVLAFPTWAREPFALVPLEAASEGCVPLISTPSGPAEWLIDGVDCLKAARDPQAFAAVLEQILQGEIDLGPIGKRASSVVRRDFSLERVLPLIEEELRQASLARGKRRPLGDHASVYRMAVIVEAMLRHAHDPHEYAR